MERAIELMRSPSHSSFDRFMGQYYFFPHFLVQEACDVTCRPEAKGFADLNIMPVSWGQKAHELVLSLTHDYNQHSETRREDMNA